MNKVELITEISEASGLSKSDSERALNAFVGIVTEELKKGNKIQLVGFGTFEVVDRAARTGTNPQTKERLRLLLARHLSSRQENL